MLIISQSPGIKHSPFCQVFTLVAGGTDDRTISTECRYYGAGSSSGRGMEAMEGFPEEVTSRLILRDKQDLKRRRG